MESLSKNSKRLINVLENTNGENLDFSHYVHLYTLDNLQYLLSLRNCRILKIFRHVQIHKKLFSFFLLTDSLLESDLNLQNNQDCRLDKYLNDMMDITMERFSKLWLYPNIIFKNSSLGKWLHENLTCINNITNEIIKKKKESIQEEKFTREGNGPYASKLTKIINIIV
ncbi:PREDICTED: uncharacterized protein LOC107071388 [Polistes dominula]|uniref:Uncharacterized protein LOC107071388 n=1 Tax=Polistes dominula TaxID=743375 RepID=A0ABM1J055_POLDO|nr:PREDICTED: uncharacterized protein LOC107071388 [Polistes dominula]